MGVGMDGGFAEIALKCERSFRGERETTMTVDAANAAADPSRAGLTGLFGGIATAIRKAADATGASFEYLLATAKMESNFNPQAAAPTSSAKGLFQFIEQTWLGTVRRRAPHSAIMATPTPSPNPRRAAILSAIPPRATRS